MKKKLAFLLVVLALSFPIAASAKVEGMNITFKGDNFSADLRNVKLKLVLQQLREAEGIWFKGDKSLLEQSISVQFENLSIEKGIKRILGNLGYSFVFDASGRVIGVTVVGKGGSDSVPSHFTEQVSAQESSPFSENNGDEELPDAFRIIPGVEPPGGEISSDDRNPDAFKIIENAPPPGGPVDESSADADAFQIIENAPPPGSELNKQE